MDSPAPHDTAGFGHGAAGPSAAPATGPRALARRRPGMVAVVAVGAVVALAGAAGAGVWYAAGHTPATGDTPVTPGTGQYTPAQEVYLAKLRGLGIQVPGPNGTIEDAFEMAARLCASPMSRADLAADTQDRLGWSPHATQGVVDAAVAYGCPGKVWPADGPRTNFGDGTFVVGTDIQPGIYRTDGPYQRPVPGCYWARLSGLGGTTAEIIANASGNGPTTVTVRAGDAAFESSGCLPWAKIE